jgi:hypothetical protein
MIFVGKFAQQPSYVETKDVFHMDDFEAMIQADDKIIKNVVFHRHGARTVSYERRKELLMLPKHSNYAVAAFTTAHARLRLYQALKYLDRDVLYMDTDSVIFVEREPLLTTGMLLGDLTDELDNDYITTFVSAGPKSYGYVTAKGKKECKIKGFTLNFETSKILNVDSLTDLILNDRKRKIRTTPLQFDIDAEHNIVTKKFKEDEGKFFKVTFDKRIIGSRQSHMIDTFPYADKNTMNKTHL